MHHILEILMPPTGNVKESIEQILAPFDENADEEIQLGGGFWDFWVIGGRFSGNKLQASLDQDKLKQFNNALSEMKVTVSGVTCGKQSLSPESQIKSVDALWRDYFPDSTEKCPFFAHSNDQYSSESTTCMDVCELKNTPKNLECGHFIHAAMNYNNTKLEAVYMIEDSMWNGVSHIDTGWNGLVNDAIKMSSEKMKNYKEEYRQKITPKDDWLLVTVDYHS